MAFEIITRLANKPLMRQLGVCRNISLYTAVNNVKSLGIDRKPLGEVTIPETRKKIDVSTAEWHFVERLISDSAIPKPPCPPGEVTPSGYVVPTAKFGDYPYHVSRNVAHMLRVYLKHQPKLQRYVTYLRGVEGDIFLLGEEIRMLLTKLHPNSIIRVRVHEPHQVIQVKGDYVNDIKEYLLKKGF
ncbi:mitochondrial ribosomal protein L49 [Oratosquilla oratoria]|uniref:mitochondrial ribosomal protein L49 n=1 Tax=Oratosquilla oratoria TaxID=337810 RepID=UPI003F761EA7